MPVLSIGRVFQTCRIWREPSLSVHLRKFRNPRLKLTSIKDESHKRWQENKMVKSFCRLWQKVLLIITTKSLTNCSLCNSSHNHRPTFELFRQWMVNSMPYARVRTKESRVLITRIRKCSGRKDGSLVVSSRKRHMCRYHQMVTEKMWALSISKCLQVRSQIEGDKVWITLNRRYTRRARLTSLVKRHTLLMQRETQSCHSWASRSLRLPLPNASFNFRMSCSIQRESRAESWLQNSLF